MRLTHTQVWPALRNLEAMSPSTAASTSASSKTMKGALPPSSIETFFMVAAAWAVSSLPTSVDPVKLILRTPGCEVSTAPMGRAAPVTTLTVPAGAPARSRRRTRARAVRGV
ncbi:hypothetical protein D3C87_1909860 [compost metagenome]